MEWVIDPYTLFVVTAALILSAAAYLEHRLLLRARATVARLQRQGAAGEPKQVLDGTAFSALAGAPFPVCAVGDDGVVLWENRAFSTLISPLPAPGSRSRPLVLAEIDRRYGTNLTDLARSNGAAPHDLIFKPSLDSDLWRRFLLIRWSAGPGSRLFAFYERTYLVTRATQRNHFEAELIQMVSDLGIELQDVTQRFARSAPGTQGSLAETLAQTTHSLTLTAAYLQTVHRSMRQHVTSQHFNLTPLLKDLVRSYRSRFRQHGIHCTLATPKDAQVAGSPADYSVALISIFDTLIAQLSAGETIAIHVDERHGLRTLDLHLPSVSLSEAQLRQVFHFSKRQGVLPVKPERAIPSTAHSHAVHPVVPTEQLCRLQLAVSREVLLKHSGNLQVRSHPSTGTTYTLSFPIPNRTRRS